MKSPSRLRYFLVVACFFLVSAHETAQAQNPAPWVGEDFSGFPCAGNPRGYGPFDYLLRSRLQRELKIVEVRHFTKEVERLESGSSASIEADLDYTLRAWPNHHRALYSLMRLQEESSAKELRNMRSRGFPAAECYLMRAMAFSSADATVRMLMAMHLQKNEILDEAKKVYEEALTLKPSDMQIRYNYALLLVDVGDLEEARKIATDLYARGMALPGLKRKLETRGIEIE